MSGADEREEGEGPDSAAMRALLRRAFEAPRGETGAQATPPGRSAADAPPAPDLLRGVQRKIRRRSRGKFFADGWSTTQSRVNYGLVAAVMLLLLVATYVALGPTGISASP